MSCLDNLCMNCMKNKGDNKVCPFCGYDNLDKQPIDCLKKGTVLQEKYVVGKVAYRNGESICYIGYDIRQKEKIYIKEYFPLDICTRDINNLRVIIKKDHENDFSFYMDEFLVYFRNLAKMRDLYAIESVYDIFGCNCTSYAICEAIDGIKLSRLIEKNEKPIDWEIAKTIFMPVLTALDKLSKANIYHLGISPETLVIGKDGRMYITNFAVNSVRQYGIFSNCELFKGCAAPEQYVKDDKPSEKADIYGFSASLFFTLVGVFPKPGNERKEDDRLLIPIKTLKTIPPYVVSAIARGLNINEKARTQTFEKLREELTETSALHICEQDEDLIRSSNKDNRKLTNFLGISVAFIVSFIALIVLWNAYSNYSYLGADEVKESSISNLRSDDGMEEKINVPDLTNINFNDAKSLGETTGNYKLLLSERIFNDDVKEGCIISQTPKSGENISKGSNIIVSISKGPKMQKLPQIEGLTLPEASFALSKAGLLPVKVEEYSDTILEGRVIGYSGHSVGDLLEHGEEVTIIVSKGKNKD